MMRWLLRPILLCLPVTLWAQQNINTFQIQLPAQQTLAISVSKFDQKQHKLTKCGDDYHCLIDDKPFWGSDGKIPKTQLSKIIFKNKNQSVELEVSGMYDPNLAAETAHKFSVVNYYDDNWKIRGQFSDGAGSYMAEWLVVKGKAVRTIIGDPESLLDSMDRWFNQETQ